ncbi:MAG: exodeoxyribonuclease III, partial [Demequina sp.]
AIASRVGLSDVETAFPGQPAFGKPGQEPVVEARAIGAVAGGVQVWSLYVPNGRGVADPHYAYKLEFLRTLREAATGWADRPAAHAGDFNVAPTPEDIWSEEDSDAETHVTAEAREAFRAFADAGYVELSRRHLPEPHTYTFWDYQQLRFPRGEGMRIDFIYASQALAERTTAVSILRDERKGKGASDHVPVVAEIDEP